MCVCVCVCALFGFLCHGLKRNLPLCQFTVYRRSCKCALSRVTFGKVYTEVCALVCAGATQP